MPKESEKRGLIMIKKEGSVIRGYKSYEQNSFSSDEEIIGLDANVLVDLVESKEFKEEIKAHVKYNTLKIFTTNIALGEAKSVLIRKRGRSQDDAVKMLKEVIKEFDIKMITHKKEFNEVGDKWVNTIKKKMYLKKFGTFPNDCRILSNLYHQEKINEYITEDKDLEKAFKFLQLPIRIKIVGEASDLNGSKIREFFKGKNKGAHKKYRRS